MRLPPCRFGKPGPGLREEGLLENHGIDRWQGRPKAVLPGKQKRRNYLKTKAAIVPNFAFDADCKNKLNHGDTEITEK